MSETVAGLAARMKSEARDQEMAEFREYLKARIANAKRICAEKKVKGRPIPKHMVPGVGEVFHVGHSSEMQAETRVCARCKHERPLVLFAPIRRFDDESARDVVCQGCVDTEVKKAQEKAIKDGHELPKQKLPTIKQRATRMLAAARLRAWRANVPFFMRHKWVEDRLRAGVCEVTGLPFSPYGRNNFMASIDREVPDKGYIESNCRMTVWLYNAAKGTGTHEDVLRMARALLKQEKVKRKRQTAARAEAEKQTEAA